MAHLIKLLIKRWRVSITVWFKNKNLKPLHQTWYWTKTKWIVKKALTKKKWTVTEALTKNKKRKNHKKL